MPLSARKRSILNKLMQYVAALRKGQISPRDGGDIRLGDMLGDFKIAALGAAIISASPTVLSVPAARVGDFVLVQLTSDDTGGTLGAVPGVAGNGVVQITPVNAPTNNDGTVLFVVLSSVS